MDRSLSILLDSNGACISSQSSQLRGCSSLNLLNSTDRMLWLSEQGLPQEVTICLSGLRTRPDSLTCFGWYCWHSYKSNPSLVELWTSVDCSAWTRWGAFSTSCRHGYSLFPIDPIPGEVQYLKIIVVDTHGAANVYINQVFLFEEMPNVLETEGSVDISLVEKEKEKEKQKDKEKEKEAGLEQKSFSYEKSPGLEQEVNFGGFSRESSVDVSGGGGILEGRMENWEAVGNSFKLEKINSFVIESRGMGDLIRNEAAIQEYRKSLPVKPCLFMSTADEEESPLRNEVGNWEKDISAIQESLEMLSSRVNKLQNVVDSESNNDLIEQIREEIIQCVNDRESSGGLGDGNNVVEEAFVGCVKAWEDKAVKPKLREFNNRQEASAINPDNILKKIEEKLIYREKLLKKKEYMQKLIYRDKLLKKKEYIEKLNTMKFRHL